MTSDAARRRAGRWHRGAALALVLALAACAGARPSLARNYELVPVVPGEQSIEALWRLKMDLASAGGDCDRSALQQATDACVAEWREQLRRLADKPPREQAAQVNHLVNSTVRYVSDDTWPGGVDRWSSPLETLRGGGDCEDLALLKRESLLALGWPEERLAIVVGTSSRSRPPAMHVVLLATLADGTQLLLDSAEPGILAPRDDDYFTPAYALTRTQIYKVMPWHRHWWEK